MQTEGVGTGRCDQPLKPRRKEGSSGMAPREVEISFPFSSNPVNYLLLGCVKFCVALSILMSDYEGGGNSEGDTELFF